MDKRLIFYWLLVCSSLYLVSLAYAAGGGGGGSSSSGLGFDSRDSIFILINSEYSEKFSLKNSTKYNLKISVVNGSADVNFGAYKLALEKGDNYLDLNGNNLADVNFRLESIKGKNANLRIIDSKEQHQVSSTSETWQNSEENVINRGEEEENDELKCSNLSSLKERVVCRLGLGEDDQEEELKLYYLPEECRDLDDSEKGICIARYKSVQTCWKFPIGEERVSCAKRAMNLGTIIEEKEKCDELAGESKSICVREIKNKNYNLIKWRFYDLEERAEDFLKRGLIDENTAIDFIAKTEQNKMMFNEEKTKEGKKTVTLQVRKDWKKLVDKIGKKLRISE